MLESNRFWRLMLKIILVIGIHYQKYLATIPGSDVSVSKIAVWLVLNRFSYKSTFYMKNL